MSSRLSGRSYADAIAPIKEAAIAGAPGLFSLFFRAKKYKYSQVMSFLEHGVSLWRKKSERLEDAQVN